MSAFTVTSDDIAAPAKKPAARARRPDRVAALGASQRYDLAGTGTSDRSHWSRADSLSANSANSPDVLSKLRTRSRYETANNGYVLGLVRGRANDCIGTGPRLQLRFPETFTDPDFQRTVNVPPGIGRMVEQRWSEWCDAIGLVDKLHLMDRSETREGEVFAVVDTNPFAPSGTPTLDLRLYEADQCASPSLTGEDGEVDGVRLDLSGRPLAFYFLAEHPGDGTTSRFTVNRVGEWVPAEQTFHLFDPDRVGQARGIPALVPGLPLGAVMRRYTMAALGTAEFQASVPCTLESDYELPTSDDEADATPDAVVDMQQIPFGHTVLMPIPAGYKAKPMTSTQPAPGYQEFKGEVNTEMGRGMNAPRNISTGSSAEYNYSSGRLDHLPWQTSIRIRRDRIRRVLLDRLFRLWYAEAVMLKDYLPAELPPLSMWQCRWQWDGFASIDPVKDATANQIRLESGQTTLDDVCAEQGKDWEEVLEQQAREMQKRKELGLPMPGAAAKPAPAPAPDPNATPTEDTANA